MAKFFFFFSSATYAEKFDYTDPSVMFRLFAWMNAYRKSKLFPFLNSVFLGKRCVLHRTVALLFFKASAPTCRAVIRLFLRSACVPNRSERRASRCAYSIAGACVLTGNVFYSSNVLYPTSRVCGNRFRSIFNQCKLSSLLLVNFKALE